MAILKALYMMSAFGGKSSGFPSAAPCPVHAIYTPASVGPQKQPALTYVIWRRRMLRHPSQADSSHCRNITSTKQVLMIAGAVLYLLLLRYTLIAIYIPVHYVLIDGQFADATENFNVVE